MRTVLAIAITSLALAGCAGGGSQLTDAHLCEPSMPATGAVASQFFPTGNVNVPARSLLGGGKFDLDNDQSWVCIDPKATPTSHPQVPNEHRIDPRHLSAVI